MQEHEYEDSWQARSASVLYQGGFRPHDPAFETVFVSAKSSTLIDVNGVEWIDLVCGYGALNFGHSNATLTQVATSKLQEMAHIGAAASIHSVILAEALVTRLQAHQEQCVVFNSSGARAIETAWKAAASYRSGKILALSPALHGRSIATAALSETSKTVLSSFFSSQVHLWPLEKYPTGELRYDQLIASEIADYLQRKRDRVSAVLLEPALTARGYVFPCAEFFQAIRKATAELGILLVADEIQTGLGRCAKFLLSAEQGWQADLTVLGKSLGGGLFPISAVVGRKDILRKLPSGVESETFAGMPAAAAVGAEVLRMLEQDGHFEKGCEIARLLSNALQKALGHDAQIQIRAASCVIEFAIGDRSIETAQEWARDFIGLCGECYLRVQWSGAQKTRIVLLPALTMRDDELKTCIERLSSVSASLLQRRVC
ncbi:MAG: aminotransferase class III-fold pyridoxal phosphate-dependent enzyme [Planctomycetota bacterium]